MESWSRQSSHQRISKANLLTSVGVMTCVLASFISVDYVIVRADLKESVRDQSLHEVRNMVDVMATTIEAAVGAVDVIGPKMDLEVQNRVKSLIRNAKYDNSKSYFAMFDLNGKVLAHGDDPTLEDKDRLNKKDEDGVPYIQFLMQAAKEGGGFVQYKREKPDDRTPLSKIGYARMLKGDQWWIITGIDFVRIEEITRKHLDAQRMNFLLLMIALFISLGVILVFASRRIKALRYIILNEQMKALARMAEQERTFLAMELHNLASRVVVLLQGKFFNMAHVDATTCQKFEQGVMEVIQRLKEGSHDLIHKIFPLEVQRNGVKALKQLVKEETEGRDTPKVDLVMDESVARSDYGRERALYLIVQGLLQNVLIHAKASQVRITLKFQGKIMTLMVTDNGIGFDMRKEVQRVSSEQLRYGCRWMETQVEVCGGSITFNSSLGQGTTVWVTMPWPSQAEIENDL